jgi:transposase
MNIMSILALQDTVAIEEPIIDFKRIQLTLKTTTCSAACSVCGHLSYTVHSHYIRKLADLPWVSKSVTIFLAVKRFRCLNEQCERKIFSQRLTFAPAYARRTTRMEQQLSLIGYQLGGQAGAYLATLLSMRVSDTTLVRILSKIREKPILTPKVLGVDDWAMKKGKTYGTILVDLEKRQPIDLLTDREAETLAGWLKAHPGVEVITRDRATCYATGATAGAPNAIQIADRWHLLKNLGEALKRMLEKATPKLRLAAQAIAEKQKKHKEAVLQSIPVIGPNVSLSSPTAQSALLFMEAKKLLSEGKTARAVARMLRISRTTVTRYKSLEYYPPKHIPKHQQSTVLPFKHYLIKRWEEGERNLKQLWREIQQQGYTGAAGSVYRFFENLPKDGQKLPLVELEVKNWTPTKVQYLLSKAEENFKSGEKEFLSVLFELFPQAQLARKLALSFQAIFKNKEAKALPQWIREAKSSGIPALNNFATGLESDYSAVEAAATYQWSNGQVEGQVNRLKIIKRQMYGRAGFNLLRKRVVFNHSAP